MASLVRKGPPSKASEILSIEYLRECFDYRDGVLYWKERPPHHFASPAHHATFIKKSAGTPAGRKEPRGYVCVKFRNRGEPVCVSVHRIVWAMHKGEWPRLHLDHINRVRHDNRIENLREVTPAENAKNSSWKRVYPYVHPGRPGTYTAQIKVGETPIHIGVFDSEREAHEYRLSVLAELEKLTRRLAKKSPTARWRKDDGETPGQNHQGVDASGFGEGADG